MKHLAYPFAICIALSGTSLLAVTAATSQDGPAGVEHVTGVFDDGQQWQLSVPADWNGVVINDLDSVGRVESSNAIATYFLDNGYAYTGTQRHPDRGYNWNPRAESDNMVRVLDMFEEHFGAPTHAIQFGCSGGGSVALSVAEDHPDRFDGAVAMHASSPIELANMRLDLSVALKALLDPDGEVPVIIEEGEQGTAEDAWLALLEEAQATPEGRAKMALAAAVAQYPMWGSQNEPQAEKPDWNDPQSVQEAMVRAAVDGVRRAVTGRPQWDQPAGLMSWTVDVDYRAAYENANAMQKDLVLQMYEAAGLGEEGIEADIESINAYPRIAATEEGIAYWRERNHTGEIGIPVLHVSNIADGGTPAAVMAGYQAKIDQAGAEALYRQVFIDAAGHCTYNTAEQAALANTIMERIETGEWGDTSPQALNAVGTDSGYGESRFIALDENTGFSLPDPFNRIFFSTDEVPGLQ